MAVERLPFEIAKPNADTFVTKTSEIGHNGQPLDKALEELDNISKQSTQSEEQAVVFTTDGGVEVGKIDSTGADFTNLKRGGQQVARMSDLPTKDTSIGENPSTTHVPTTAAVKEYVDENSMKHLPMSEESTQSEDEEFVASNDAGTDTYAKVGSYGVKAKAYKKLNGDDAIPPLDTTIGDNPSNSHTPSTQAVKTYVDAHGVGNLPISGETTQSEDEEVIFSNEAGNQQYIKAGSYGIKAKEYFDLDGNPISGKKTITCWGDSITSGHPTYGRYPEILGQILGSAYKVENMGISSAWMQDISARLGGALALLKNDVSVGSGIASVILPRTGSVYNKFQSSTFQICPRQDFPQSVKAYDPVIINDDIYKFEIEGTAGTDNINIKLTRINGGSAIVIPSGSAILPYSLMSYAKSDISVIFMGTNNMLDTGANFLNDGAMWQMVKQYHDACISSLVHKDYIILGMFHISNHIVNGGGYKTDAQILEEWEEYERLMEETYGAQHFIPLRKLLSSQKALDDAVRLGYLTSQEVTQNQTNDAEWMAKGCAAYSFMRYRFGTDYIHPYIAGYKMIAYYIAQRLKLLNN